MTEQLHAGHTLAHWDATGAEAHNAGLPGIVPRKLQASKSFPAQKVWLAGWTRAMRFAEAQRKLPKPVGEAVDAD